MNRKHAISFGTSVVGLAILGIAALLIVAFHVNSINESLGSGSDHSHPIHQTTLSSLKDPTSSHPLNPAQRTDATLGHLSQTEQFKSFLETTLESLPSTAALNELDGEALHTTPELLIDGAVQIALVSQAMAENADLRNLATDFFLRCAQSHPLAAPVRSLCYSHLVELDPRHFGEHHRDDLIPEEIQHLASSL